MIEALILFGLPASFCFGVLLGMKLNRRKRR